jgi:replication initiation and membrane attachment protein DnaB
MRWAKSYSIIDHQFLHQGYFQRLGIEALALYLFLIVVADREGKSYYAEKTVAEVLRLSPQKYSAALSDLVRYGLVDFRRPFYWVKNLSSGRG